MKNIDEVILRFNADNLMFLNVSLAFIMFGVALELTLNDFKRVLREPKAAFAGLFSQFVILPLLTFLIIYIIQPRPSFALGMMMVAACPGGNISNFFTSWSKGNVALSVSLTAVSSLLAIFMTPINLSVWGRLYTPTAHMLSDIDLNVIEIFYTVVFILGIPVVVGMLVRAKFPVFAKKIHPYMRAGSLLLFAGIVVFALIANFDIFLNYIYLVVGLVFLHNALALASGYSLGALLQLPENDRRTLSIETGIQNSGLGLVLIFAFFDGLGGMAIVAAWWGIWHILSGVSLSLFWKSK